MTQSGQGDEQQPPAVRPAHEGVVLPAGGGEPWTPGRPADRAAPAEGQPWGQPWGPQASHQDAASQGQDPYGQQQQAPYGQEQQASYGQGQQSPAVYGQQHGQYGGQGQYDQGQQAPAYGQDQQQGHQGQQQGHQEPAYGQAPQGLPLPPAQPQGPYAQPLPPEAVPGMGMGGDADATQYIAPVPAGPAPGGLPPAYQQPPAAGHAAPPAQGGQDADATQFIPPVPGGTPYGIRPGTPGERPPPAEFDNLFRSDEHAGATQQMPQIAPAQQRPPQHQGPGQPPQAYQQAPAYGGPQDGPPQEGRDERRKRPAHVPLIAAVVVGCAVIGLGAGALLSGGDDGKDNKQPVAEASSPAAERPTEAAADPAKSQAEALDKLLADSNNSRAAVIGAVEKTKTCTDLDQAVADLKGAAQQRRDLVTRLKELSVDKLPDNGQLTASLTRAWQASASADDHYAAWASQAKSRKVCKHGNARSTPQRQQADTQSGEASKAKNEASKLWNTIAKKYGLTEREATAL
ncbi:hypothetical protein [Streptomyces brevispora]|uniref:Uncharacterized protein n=1 Tax=Streptomyces brevispora TaxID=887462 RepID=A0ABZ1G2E9_9ACTN|nr:hypothetical protein [Streptomyces brevispora]WSC14047.1 hypothetical protein OIE64_15115 [Streptomyces brevispora]